jgi:hypothetical protein
VAFYTVYRTGEWKVTSSLTYGSYVRSTSVTESLTKIFPKLDIRYNIGTKNSYTYTHDELDSLLEQAQNREMC